MTNQLFPILIPFGTSLQTTLLKQKKPLKQFKSRKHMSNNPYAMQLNTDLK